MMAVNGLETADIENTNVKGMGTKIVASENKKEKGWMILTNRVWAATLLKQKNQEKKK
jgi:hypothetical protein